MIKNKITPEFKEEVKRLFKDRDIRYYYKYADMFINACKKIGNTINEEKLLLILEQIKNKRPSYSDAYSLNNIDHFMDHYNTLTKQISEVLNA